MSELPTVSQDLEKILDYLFTSELQDFIDHFDRGEMEVDLTIKEMEDFVEQSRHRGNAAYEDLAAEHAITHIFGSIVRVGRQLLGW